MITAGSASADDPARSDRELVDARVGGDLAALGTLYGRHASLAYGFALRLTGDPGRAEDVVQSAFMSLWTDRAESGKEADAVRPRLVRLVARAAMDAVRRQHPLRGPGSVKPRADRRLRQQPLPGLPHGR